MSKNCIQCSKEIIKSETCSLRNWENKTKFCSAECHNIFRKGKPSCSPSTTFQKGISYNKGHEGLKGEKNPKWKGGKITLNCKICEMDFQVFPGRSEAKTCSRICFTEYQRLPEVRLARSEVVRKLVEQKLKGVYSYITSLDKIIRHSAQYKFWRKEVFERDDYTCQFCRIRGGELRADHINQFAIILLKNDVKTFDDALICAELWDTNNGRTLCNSCHIQTPTYARRIT